MTGHTKESHKKIRALQKENDNNYHHPVEKIKQLDEIGLVHGDILEIFAGSGNLSSYYKTKGVVTAMTKDGGNSFDAIYQIRANKKKYDVIDIDSYGYPDRFFPVVFEMMKDKCLLVFTFPIVGVNALNGITEQHFITFWRSARPTIGDITGILTDMALREWRLLQLIDVRKIKRIWRLAYMCERKKATELTFVRNR